MKPLTPHMKSALLDLYAVVMAYDNGEPLHPHDVTDVHHKILRGLDSRKLILLEASYCPTGVIWTVALTVRGLREAKKLAKQKQVINDTSVNDNGKKKKLPRKLRTIQWQVNVSQETGEKIYEDAMKMKADKKQSFTKTMNNLFALHKELKAGQVGLLQALYPEAYTAMLLIAQNEIEMERESRIEDLLEELKRHMVSQPAPTGSNSSEPQTIGLRRVQPVENEDTGNNGIRQINTNVPIAAPVFDDEDDEDMFVVEKDKDAARRVYENFTKSMLSLGETKSKGDTKGLSGRQKALFND